VNVARTFFIAGIIQGSMLAQGIHSQDYRRDLRRLLRDRFPDDLVYCPFEHHPASLEYDDTTARETFLELMRRAGEADVLVAFVPEASMGTAIELWQAYHGGAWVYAVSPLTTNWAVRYLADRVFEDLAAFQRFVVSGELAAEIASPPRRGL
jgi:hypothetical protein